MKQIELKNVTKQYGEKQALTTVLSNFNLSIHKGELIAIVGSSGSGKTTLLNIIGSLLDIDEGSCYFENKNLSDFSESEKAAYRNDKIGFVLQNFGLINNYSVLENVMLPCEFNKKNRKRKKEIAMKLLKLFDLSSHIHKLPYQLSGGQKQRVALARALVNNPSIILADEPTGSLDKETGNKVFDTLKRINEEGKTVIIVTHESRIANQCRRIISLEDGKIISDVNR